MKLTAAANLLSQHSHAILNDCNDFETLKKVLSLAFPEDVEGKKHELHKDDEGSYYGYDLLKRSNWTNIGDYLERLQIIKLSDIIEDEDSNDKTQVFDSEYVKPKNTRRISELKETDFNKVVEETPSHYDNSKGSIYQFCENQKLNSYEFDLIKRIVRCRKKGVFKEDLEKTKVLIDLYLKEFENV